jgi:hypothetical protein
MAIPSSEDFYISELQKGMRSASPDQPIRPEPLSTFEQALGRIGQYFPPIAAPGKLRERLQGPKVETPLSCEVIEVLGEHLVVERLNGHLVFRCRQSNQLIWLDRVTAEQLTAMAAYLGHDHG